MNPIHPVNRRHFIKGLGGAAVLATLPWTSAMVAEGAGETSKAKTKGKIKPIKGSWISIGWDDRRHFYWNDACMKFSARQWDVAVKDVADIGMEYLVLLSIAKGGKTFYDSRVLPKAKMGCDNPIEALLSAADRYGVKFFISNGYYGGPLKRNNLLDPEITKKRFEMMGELVDQYAHHESFYGWYWTNEAPIEPYFSERYIEYANAYSREARKLTPKGRILIAPTRTWRATYDGKYVGQLERLDVDVIAYQDKVGCGRATVEMSAAAFEKLRKSHDRVPQRALWADVETFAWEGKPNDWNTPLIPSTFERLERQLAAVSPFVDTILVYQFQGLMNRPGSEAYAGHPDSGKFYLDYVDWLKKNYPEMVKL